MDRADISQKMRRMQALITEEIAVYREISDNYRDEMQVKDVIERARKRTERFMEMCSKFEFGHRHFEIMRHVPEEDAKKICATLRGPRVWQSLWLCRRWTLTTKETGNTYIFSPRKVHVVIDYW